MQDKQELKVSCCFWSFRFPSLCYLRLLIAAEAKKPRSGQTLRWLKFIGPVLQQIDLASPAPVKEASFHCSMRISALLVWSQNAWPHRMKLSCNIHRFMEGQAIKEHCNQLLWVSQKLNERPRTFMYFELAVHDFSQKTFLCSTPLLEKYFIFWGQFV